MTDRPIIMSTESVKAILDGKKTMTRRVIKPQPLEGNNLMDIGIPLSAIPKCPYGQVGDRLWVREAWSVSDGTLQQKYIYKADGLPHPDVIDAAGHRSKGRWRPSIFMPRWASRITLEITEVRAERLQEITPQDIKAEGINPLRTDFDQPIHQYEAIDKRTFKDLWDSLNAKRGYGWEVNPWVWVISFKKEQKDE